MSRPPVHGAVVIDKPEGPTSFTAMRVAARALGMKKAGHTGTLDPAASGVMVVLLGEATKLSGVLVHDDKVYEAAIRLGVATDTLDREGAITATAEVLEGHLEPARIEAALAALRGPLSQIPPVYSAIKSGGRSLMSRARAGEVVEPEARSVICYESALLSIAREPHPELRVRIHCGKGFYVRSFARDLGALLGLPAHLSALRRTRVGGFDVASALLPEDAADAPIIPIPALLPSWHHLALDAARAADIRAGRPIPRGPESTPGDGRGPRALALAPDGTPLALLEPQGQMWKVSRGFVIDIDPSPEYLPRR